MGKQNLSETAQALVTAGKGILAADETPATLGERFSALGIPSTPQHRRDYRELLITTPLASQFISGMILQDETLRQADERGNPLVELLTQAGIIPGIKVDAGARPLAGCAGELVTEGLDGLRARLEEYWRIGARFAKWRAVIRVDDHLPSRCCVAVNAHALARYAALCQEQGLVPIVEPEVLMDGQHSFARAEAVTAEVLDQVFQALRAQRVILEGMLLKPNMIVPGNEAQERAPTTTIAAATLRVLRRHVPAAVPGIVFLSGGQGERQATANLNAVNTAPGGRPWRVSFSYGRALQDHALAAWRGRPSHKNAAQAAFYRRAQLNGAATLGRYDEAMEREGAPSEMPAPTVH
jgi:fructose-bisphosphate aldolase, class I